MLVRFSLVIVTSLLVALLAVPSSYADVEPKNRGLFITPLREHINVAAGQREKGKITVANITDKPAVVTLSVEQFSVANYTYDYIFSPVKEDWIKFETPQLELQPGKSLAVPYVITASPQAIPGGHYFTLFATKSIEGGVVSGKERVATVLYVEVAGDLHKTSTVEEDSIPWISFGGDIPFTLNVRNTGNTHFFTYVSGKLSGLSASSAIKEATHILLPDTTRSIGASISAPLLPGVYSATYGYKTDNGSVVTRSKMTLYAPPWALAFLAGFTWLLVILVRRQRRRIRKERTADY